MDSSEIRVRSPIAHYNVCFTKNAPVKIPKLFVNQIQIPDEYDATTVCNHFEDRMRVLMLGDLPGVGKSYACKQMESCGHNVLFVCPTNDLCIDNVLNSGIFAVTVSRFFWYGFE